ncbi:hypothetical protein NA57DRAFT_60005 [Rhizodiscina lignyota]|uniref:Uncharacterized protein n=1 Tax=Rhizodiscina lignyota TaxID=1504668 RepID=A0A9P4I5C1_9PEZI|nr:hypothetical protein NA57DRAFT_60005 [Rhizodiscina lignyota]
MRPFILSSLLYARFALSQTGAHRGSISTSSSSGNVPGSTTVPSNATITSGVCTGCLLEALNPYTIPDPTTFKDSNSTTVITTATVIRSTTFFDPPTPVPYEVHYYTETVHSTKVIPGNFSTLSTSVYTFSGVPLTWPTQYVLYSTFATADKCAASPTQVSIPEATDLARLIYPVINGSALPLELVQYLETFPEFDGVDLTNCSSLALSVEHLARRQFGRVPFPFGPRADALPLFRRGINSTTTAESQPSPVPADNLQQRPPNHIVTGVSSSIRSTASRSSTSSTSSSISTSSSTSSSISPLNFKQSGLSTGVSSAASSSSSSSRSSSSSLSVAPLSLKPSILSTEISSVSISSASSLSSLSSTINSTSESSHSQPSNVVSRPSHIPISRTFASSLSVHIQTDRRSRPHLPLSTASPASVGTGTMPHPPLSTGYESPHNRTEPGHPHKPHKPDHPHRFNATGEHHHHNGTNCRPCTAFFSQPEPAEATSAETSTSIGPVGGIGTGPDHNKPPKVGHGNGGTGDNGSGSDNGNNGSGSEASTEINTQPAPASAPPIYKTSVAVLTQVTSDASTTVKAPGTVSHPAPVVIPTHNNQPGNPADSPAKNPNAGGGSGAAGGGQAQQVPASESSNTNAGSNVVGGLVPIIQSAAKETATVAAAPPKDGGSGSPGGSNGGQQGAKGGHGNGGGNGGEQQSTGPEHGSTSSSGPENTNPQSDHGSGSGPSESNNHGGSGNVHNGGSGGSGGQPEGTKGGPGSSGGNGEPAGSSGGHANSGNGDGNDAGSGIGNAVAGVVGAKPSNNAGNSAPAQTVNIGGTPVAVHALPTSGGNAGSGSGHGPASNGASNEVFGGSISNGGPHGNNVGGSPGSTPEGSSANPGNGVVIGGQTIQPGQATTINNVPVSVGPSGSALVVGGSSTVNLQGGAGAPQTVNVGGSPLPVHVAPTPVPGSSGQGVVIGGQTLQPGQTGSVNGVPVVVGSGGSSLVVGGTSTIGLQAPPSSLNIGGKPVAVTPAPASDSGSIGQGVVIGGQTIQAGHTGTINGVPVVVGNGGSSLIVGGTSTVGLQGFPSSVKVGGSPVAITPAPNAPAANGNSGVVIGSQTVQPGQVATINGQQVSVGSSGSSLVIGGTRTVGLQSSPTSVDIGGSSVPISNPANSGSGNGVDIGGQTVGLGQTADINGVPVSVGNDGSSIVIGGTRTVGLQESPKTINIGGTPIAVNSGITPSPNAGGLVVGGKTLTPGEVTTINGQQVSVGSDGSDLVIGGTRTVHIQQPTGAPTLQVGSSTITAKQNGEFVFGDKTLSPGGPAITVSGTQLSLAPSGGIVVINGKTSTLAGSFTTPTNAPVLTVGGKPFTASVSGGSTQFVLPHHQTLTPGGVVTVSGTTISLPATGAGSVVVLNGHTSTLGVSAPFVTNAPVITAGGHQFTATVSAGTTEFEFDNDQTLTPGGAVTVSGTRFSLPATGGSIVTVNDKTSTLGQAFVTPAAVLTVNGHEITASVEGTHTEFDIGPGTTLTRGGVLTISGTTYSFPATGAGSVIVVNGHISTLGTALITAAPALTIGSRTYQPTISGSSTYYVINGKTLTPGGNVTIHGTGISLGNSESYLVIGDKTSTIKGPASASTTPTTTSGLGGAINSGLSGPDAGASATTSKHSAGTRIALDRIGFIKLLSFVMASYLFFV